MRTTFQHISHIYLKYQRFKQMCGFQGKLGAASNSCQMKKKKDPACTSLLWCLILKPFGMTETGAEDYFILRQRSFQKYLSEVSALLDGGQGGFSKPWIKHPKPKKRSGNQSSHSSQPVLKWSWLRPTQEHLRLVWQEGEWKIPCSDQCLLSLDLLLLLLDYHLSGTGWGSTYASTCIPNKAFKAKSLNKEE